MQEFITINRQNQEKRNVEDRLKDYNEIYKIFNIQEAKTQASRCIQCGDPFCHNTCPLHNYIPYWLKNIAKNNEELAFKLSNETNPFPEITGRVCPQEKLCEGDCSLNSTHGAISIGAIETSITENALAKGYELNFKDIITDKKVAIIGSGPAGIAAATYLLRAGIGVDMYEKDNFAGGLLTYGIPGFKLQKDIIKRRIKMLQKAKLNLFTNTNVGVDISFEEILNSHEKVILAIGARKQRSLNIANINAKGCFLALDFLVSLQKQNFHEQKPTINFENKEIVVIGGGDTAMDCVRSSLRLGAKKVTLCYRRDENSMPGSKKERQNAIDEGAFFEYNFNPKEIILKNNEVSSIILEQTNPKSLEIIKDSEFEMRADYIIFALGFLGENQSFLGQNNIKTSANSLILTNEFQTSHKKVYAIGDCKNGSDLVVRAASDGKRVAEKIIKKILK